MRSLDTDVRNSLLKEEPFVYAHLLKFERPLKTDSGKSARRAKDYVYITDGSFDIKWDDESTDVNGVANGAQNYIANKLVKVGSVSETTEARASSINLQVSGAALGINFTDSITISTSSIVATKDFTEEGFREGDVVLLESPGGSNHTVKVRIDSFSNSNKTANITPLSKVVSGQRLEVSSLASETRTYDLFFDNPEVEGILSNRSDTSYGRYINRDVFIYKVHINPETGAIIGQNTTTFKGGAYLLFKGIIEGGTLQETPDRQSLMSWRVTSHWGDFQRVSGRLTSDAHHRALDQSGVPDTGAVVRPAYATDLGFMHSETAVNLMAIYQVMETRYKEKRRGGLAGLLGGKKLVEYEVEVDREVDLRFNLDAKYLPVVYGVNKIDSIPVFVDTLNTDAKQIFVAYALCEGEISGVFDIYFDDTNSICLDLNDSQTRSTQTSENTIDVLCTGRMDRGNTLTPNTIVSGVQTQFYGHHTGYEGGWNRANQEIYAHSELIDTPNTNFGSGSTVNATGLTHEKGTSFVTPIDAKIQFHSGKPNQKASPILVRNASNFKVGTDYYTGSEAYWGASHQLLDTAYVVAQYTIGEGETSIPSLDFVVRGKGIDCYDYDYSYSQDPAYVSADASSSTFDLGGTYTAKYTATDATISTTLVIADIYTHTNMDGTTDTKFRFKDDGGIAPAFKEFYIENSSNGKFHFVKYDHQSTNGTVDQKLEETITSVASNSNGTSIDVTMSGLNATKRAALDLANDIAIADVANFVENGSLYPERYLDTYNYGYTGSGNTITAVGNSAAASSEVVSQVVTVKDAISLGSGSSSDDAYNDYIIEVTRKYSDNTTKVQRRTIIDYDGGEQVASVDSPFDEDAIPNTGDTWRILSPKAGDVRVSLNPAMQLLDYLKSKRYGRDLTDDDIDLSSFLQAARDCDTRSDVTVITTAEPTVGDIYKYPATGKPLFVGTVKSKETVSISGLGTRYNVTLEDVAGKLIHRWTSETYFYTGELYFHNGYINAATSNGAVTGTPSSSGVSSISLTRTSGSGPSTLSLDVSSARLYDGNSVVKKYSSGKIVNGYNLYDSSDVKYWRYLGWESQNQRHVTRHQTNAVINTARPIFENVNSMLGQFNGILRYSNGKYSLAVKKAAAVPTQVTVDGVTYTIGDISEEDIIGEIKVEDAGQKGTFNSVSVSVQDPQNLFESRSVSLFNSTYLKQDRMVPKKGTVKTPNVSNYFNARINAKQYLDDSRAGLKVNFTLAPSGILLRAGDIIRLTYPRFGWDNKLYRIKNLNFQENCLVQVTAEEHNDDGYIVQPDFPLSAVPAETAAANVGVPGAPTLDDPAQNKRGGVVLNWTNTSAFNPAFYTVQIWRSADDPHGNDRTNAVMIGTSKGTTFTDPIVEPGVTTYYYWIRYAVNIPQQRTSGVAPREIFSAYHPTGATAGKSSSAAGTIDGMMVSDVNDNPNILCNDAGVPFNFNNTNAIIKAFVGGTPLKYDNTSPYGNNTFRVTGVVATNVTQGAVTALSNGVNVAYASANITAMDPSADTGSLVYTVVIKNAIGEETTFESAQRFTKVKNGTFGKTVELLSSKYVINYSTAGAETDSLTLTATARNFGSVTPYFEFLIGGTVKQAAATGSGTPAQKTFTLPDSDEPAIGGTTTVVVKVRDGAANGTVVAEDSVTIYAVQDGSDAVTGFLTNEAHTVGSDFLGNVTLGAAGGDFRVFVGGTNVTTSCTFAVASETGVDVSINSGNGIYSVNSMSADTGTADFTATIPAATAGTASNVVLTKTYTISRAKGAAPGFEGSLTSESDSFTADVNGNVSSTDLANAGGTFVVKKDGVDVSSNSNVTFAAANASGMTASINNNGVYTVSAFPASSTTGTVEFTATIASSFTGTGSAITITKTYTLSKGVTGADGTSGSGVAELTIYYQYSPYGSGGTASFPSTPSTGTFNFGTGVVASLPTGWTQSEPGTGTGTITVQSTTLATESSSGSGVSGTLSWSSPSFVRGAPGSTNFIFIYSSSQPSTPNATDAVTNNGIPTGWSDGIPTNPNNGSKLWSSKGKAVLSGNILSGSGLKVVYNWETPVVHVQAKSDVGLGNVDNDSTQTIRSGTTSTDVGLGNVANERQINIFRQASAPTANAVGDLWIDTDDDNVVYRWDGSNWVVFTPGLNVGNFTAGTMATGRGGTGTTDTTQFRNSSIGFGSLVNGQITINRGAYSGITLSGLNNGFVGLANVPNVNATNASNISSGALNTARGGTGETNTARFLNSSIGISTSNNGIVIARGGGYSNVSITGLDQSLVNLSGVTNNADQTSSNTANDTSNVNGTAASTVQGGAGRANAGLTNTGVVNLAVPTGKGGTGETNTARFLNNSIAISTSNNGITIARGGGYSTTSITGLSQALVGLSGVSNNADETSSNTANDTSNVNGTAASTVSGGAARANSGLTNTGVVNLAVPTGKGGTGETNTARFLNNSISISTSSNGITIARGGGYSTTSITGLSQALVGLSGVSNNADQTSANTANDTSNVNGTSAATVVSRANAGATVLAASQSMVGYSVYEGTGSGSTKSTLPSGNTTVTITASGAGSGTAYLTIGPNSANTAINQVSFSGTGFTAAGATSVGFGGSGGVVVTHTSSGQKVSIGYTFINAREATVAICCFTGETLVDMRDGSRKPIKDIKLGDLVLVETGTAEVIELHPTILGDRKLYSLNGGKAFVTAEHPFRTEEGWKSIDPEKTKLEREGLYEELTGALKVGDKVLKTDGVYHEITEITSVDGDPNTPLYNFTVNLEDHSYFADGYCVHNK